MPKCGEKTPLQNLDQVIDRVVATVLCDLKKHPGDFTRTRKLPADIAIKVILNMEGQSIRAELDRAFPDIDERMTKSAFVQVRDKLCTELFLQILYLYNDTAVHRHMAKGKYLLYAIDGSDFTMPYVKGSKYAMTKPSGRPRQDGLPVKPYCQAHANMLYSVSDEIFRDIIFQPKMKADERGAAIEMLERLNPDHPYIVLMDRGYDGFNMYEHCNRLNDDGYYVIRTKAGKGAAKEIEALPDAECDRDMDFVVTTSSEYYNEHKHESNVHYIHAVKHQHKKYISPNTKRQRWDFADICHVKCRVIKFRIGDEEGKGKWEVLVTNLPRDEFSIKDMKDLYHMRWDLETAFRDLKYSLGAIMTHSIKPDAIDMELVAHLIMYNVAKQTVQQVSVPEKITNRKRYKVSFKDAVTIVRRYMELKCPFPPEKIFSEILTVLRPADSGRATKRIIKPKAAVWFIYRVA